MRILNDKDLVKKMMERGKSTEYQKICREAFRAMEVGEILEISKEKWGTVKHPSAHFTNLYPKGSKKRFSDMQQ